MDTTLMTIAGAVIFQALIMYLIIASAVKSNARYKLEWAQMKLLAEMAKKQGVDEKFIDEIVKNSQ
jgi:hypothetical protein